MRLMGKVAIVTGAGTGIGEAIAHRFAREGARVVPAGLPSDPVADVAAAIAANGGEAEPYLGDLAEETQARACVELAVRAFGRLDALVNNAGIFIANAVTESYRLEDFDRTLRDNLRTAFLMTRFALPHLQQSRGVVLFTGSEAGMNGSPKFTPYGGSKGFLHAFMKGVARTGAPRRPRQLRLSRAGRHRLDARAGQPFQPAGARGPRRHGSAGPPRDGRGDCACLRLPRVR